MSRGGSVPRRADRVAVRQVRGAAAPFHSSVMGFLDPHRGSSGWSLIEVVYGGGSFAV